MIKFILGSVVFCAMTVTPALADDYHTGFYATDDGYVGFGSEPPLARRIVQKNYTAQAYFRSNSSRLDDNGEVAIGSVLSQGTNLDTGRGMGRDGFVIGIEASGHTDSRGSQQSNARLGQRRAEAAKQFIVRQGVNPDAVTANSAGELAPVASNETAAGRAQNRRVDVTLKTIVSY